MIQGSIVLNKQPYLSRRTTKPCAMKHLQRLRAKSTVSGQLSLRCLHLHRSWLTALQMQTSCVPTAAAADVQTDLQLPPELVDFRPNVGICVVNSDGLVFAANRVDDPAKSWQMPQGGIDAGEDPLHAAVRELREETNISSVELIAELPRWLPYEFPTEVRCRLSNSWARYRGQAQRWFLFKFTGDDSEINLDTDHKEFSKWRWMPLELLPQTVVPFKRQVYEEVAAEFGQAIAAIHHQHC